jgi:hypothetical protein
MRIALSVAAAAREVISAGGSQRAGSQRAARNDRLACPRAIEIGR